MVRTLEEYAICNNIPIVEKDTLNYLIKYIKENNIKTILEIGSAIGYSAISMAQINKNINIVSIEKAEDMYKEAKKNTERFKLENQIKLILADANDIELENKFDLIFIDAAKSQYKSFFQKYENNLNEFGTIITDNIYFHGYVLKEGRIESRNLRQLVNKIKKYHTFLKENKNYETKFLKIGDGLSISIRK